MIVISCARPVRRGGRWLTHSVSVARRLGAEAVRGQSTTFEEVNSARGLMVGHGEASFITRPAPTGAIGRHLLTATTDRSQTHADRSASCH